LRNEFSLESLKERRSAVDCYRRSQVRALVGEPQPSDLTGVSRHTTKSAGEIGGNSSVVPPRAPRDGRISIAALIDAYMTQYAGRDPPYRNALPGGRARRSVKHRI